MVDGWVLVVDGTADVVVDASGRPWWSAPVAESSWWSWSTCVVVVVLTGTAPGAYYPAVEAVDVAPPGRCRSAAG